MMSMNGVWKSLIWKEWHEHRWKLAAMVAILFAPSAFIVWSVKADPEMLFVGMCFAIVPLAVFIGLGEASAERSGRTLPFLQSLPVSLWQAAVCKVVFGALCLVLPVLISLLFVWFWGLIRQVFGVEADRSLGQAIAQFRLGLFASPQLDVAVLIAVLGLSLFVWSAAIGVNRKDEISGASLVVPAMLGVWAALLVVWFTVFQNPAFPQLSRVRAIGYGVLDMACCRAAYLACRGANGRRRPSGWGHSRR
jgi:hypothetical protein